MVKTQDTYFQQEYKKKKKCYAFPIHESEILFFQFSWSIAQTPKHTLGCNEDGGRLNSHTQKIHQPRVPFLFVFISSKLPVISFIFSYILSIGGKFSWLKIQKAQKRCTVDNLATWNLLPVFRTNSEYRFLIYSSKDILYKQFILYINKNINTPCFSKPQMASQYWLYMILYKAASLLNNIYSI